eukprot:TRINITY_DN42339_c0_g1_i1.p2 TRINITY_DN42339_c0_g1~~TRINITY_DN42339_c0_g1_i1.p2  ORF type:complete len:135 (+),score=23.20 TRINITY_DN42339_c0_g1_i1:275-679(+)
MATDIHRATWFAIFIFAPLSASTQASFRMSMSPSSTQELRTSQVMIGPKATSIFMNLSTIKILRDLESLLTFTDPTTSKTSMSTHLLVSVCVPKDSKTFEGYEVLRGLKVGRFVKVLEGPKGLKVPTTLSCAPA